MTREKYKPPAIPKDKAAQVLPYLDHIDELRKQMFSYKEIANLFGMPSSTFRYALKRARTIAEQDSSVTTDEIITFDSDHSKNSCSHDLKEDATMEESEQMETNDFSGNKNTEQGSHDQVHDAESSESDQDEEEEDWAAKVMRTAIPSKYAHRFNLKLKHQ